MRTNPWPALICAVLFSGLLAGAAPGENVNGSYVSNRSPLKQTAYVHLPLGAVQPRGWLRDQLQVQADGLTSYLWSAFSFTANDANPPYHQEGVVALAYVLKAPRLIALARGYVERRITQQTTNYELTFGNASIMRFLIEYQEATGDGRIVPWMREWYRRAGPHPPTSKTWWENLGCHEHLVPLYWLYNRTGDAALLDIARALADTHDFSVNYDCRRFPALSRGQVVGPRGDERLADQIPRALLPAGHPGTLPHGGDGGD